MEWARLRDDVDAVEEVTLDHRGKRFIIRNKATGLAGKAFQAVGVALPPVLREP